MAVPTLAAMAALTLLQHPEAQPLDVTLDYSPFAEFARRIQRAVRGKQGPRRSAAVQIQSNYRSADFDDISGILHTYAYFQLDDTGNLLSIDCKLCPLINTPLIAIRLQTKLANLKLTNCNPNLQV